MNRGQRAVLLNGAFNPYRLPGIAARFDASDIGSVIASAAGRVSSWADRSGNGRNLLQATGANQPLYLPWSGTNYAYLPGNGTNYLSTPDSAMNSPTGDIDLFARVALVDWTPAAGPAIIEKWLGPGNQRAYLLEINPSGTILFGYSSLGSNSIFVNSSVAPTIADGATLWIRVTRDKATGTVTFYTAADQAAVPSVWTQLGTTTISNAGTGIFDATAPMCVSGGNLGDPLNGNVYYAGLTGTIGGAAQVVMQPSQTTNNATSWTASTGEVWTVNQAGNVVAQVVGSPSVLFDGTAYYLQAAFTLNQPETLYFVGQQRNWNSNHGLWDGVPNNTMQVYQNTVSPRVTQYAGSDGATVTTWAVGTIAVLACVYNGASSRMKLNLAAALTGNAGAGNPNGFTLGTVGNIAGGFVASQANEAMLFSGAHDDTMASRVAAFLMKKWNIP